MRLALLLIDLDGLKEVNETLGHYEARGRECPYVANAGAAVDRACPLARPAMSVPPASGATGRSGSADRPRVAVGRDDKRELRTGRAGSFRFEPAEQEPTSGWDLIARVRRVIDRAPARRPKQPCRRSWLPSRARRESDTSGHAGRRRRRCCYRCHAAAKSRQSSDAARRPDDCCTT